MFSIFTIYGLRFALPLAATAQTYCKRISAPGVIYQPLRMLEAGSPDPRRVNYDGRAK